MTSLVIVESEEKAKTLTAQSGGVYETLLLRSVPMKVSHLGSVAKLFTGETGFQFVPTEAEKDFVRSLLVNLHKDIYVALESDLQGEYWSWMLSRFVFAASKGEKGIRRVHVAGFAEDELAESFRLVEPVQDSTAAAFYIRSLFNGCLLRHVHRLLGTVHGPGGLPLNFAALTTLSLLEEREAEVDAFSAPAKWQLKARAATPDGDVTLRLQEAYGITDDGFFRDPGEVKKALALFEGQPLVVKGVTRSDLTIEPPMPYRLGELLHDAYTMLKMGPAKVLQAIQTLYAGLTIDGRQTGLISAPFAVLALPHQATLSRIRKEVAAVYGGDALIERQPDGHVILPLLPALAGEQLQDVASQEERQLYELIRGRALASQMPAAVGHNLLMECTAGGCLFQGRSPLLTTRGFLQAFAGGNERYLSPRCPLDNMQAGQEITVEQLIPEQSSGVTAEYYTFDSLSDDLAEFALPLASALIRMLQDMLDKGYLAVDDRGCLHIEGNAAKVVATMNRAFPAMKGIALSAYLAQTAGEVISGRKNLDFALKQFEQNFVMHGVPLVKIQVPRAVPVRERVSKNIIKSPEPESVRPLQPVEPAVLQALAAKDFNESQAAEPVTEVAGVNPEAASKVDAGSAESPQAAEQEKADVVLASDLPQAEGENGEALASMPEITAPGEMPGAEEVPSREPLAESAAEGVATGMAEEQEAAQGAVFEEPLQAEGGQEQPAVQPVPGEAAVDTQPREEEQERVCPDCGRPLLLKNDRFGRYWACSGYPACRHSESYEPGQEKMELLCPLCRQESLVIKRTPTGKKLYVCPGEGCEFMAWSQPHAVDCPACGSPFLVEKKTAGGKTVLRCPRAGCSYLQALDGEQVGRDAGAGQAPARKKVLVRRSTGSSGAAGKKKVLVRRKKS